MVGLIPLFAVETLEPELLERLPGFKRRLQWFIENRPDLTEHVASHAHDAGTASAGCCPWWTAISCAGCCRSCWTRPSSSRPTASARCRAAICDDPYRLHVDGIEYPVAYEPAESTTGLFGGNSNWRGPIWFPMNFLLIESLQKFHHYFGDELQGGVPHRLGAPR